MRQLKRKQHRALFEVLCLGQRSHQYDRPTRAERKAAKWSYRVLEEQDALPKTCSSRPPAR